MPLPWKLSDVNGSPFADAKVCRWFIDFDADDNGDAERAAAHC